MMLCTVLIAGLLAPQEWPTYHGDFALTGVADTAPPDEPVRLWRFKSGESVGATPVSAGGKVFFTTLKGSAVALDLEGKQIWSVKLKGDTFEAPPLCTEGMLIAGAGSGRLIAYDATSGKERWTCKVGDSLMGTANRVEFSDGRKGIIAISQSDGSIHCVEPDTGKPAWKTKEFERCDGSPAVGGGRIVMGSCASALHIFSVQKQARLADIELGDDGQVAAGVALSGTMAFAGTRNGKLCAVDVVARKVVWTNGDAKGEAFTTPAVDKRHVVFSASDGKVYCLARETGKAVWSHKTGGSPSSPVIAGERVVVASSGSLYLLELATGKQIWTAKVSDEITSPAVVGGRVIVGADDGTVTAFGRK